MTAKAKLTDTQTAIIKTAAGRPDGNIEPLPPTLRGGARTKVIEGLLARAAAIRKLNGLILQLVVGPHCAANVPKEKASEG